MLVSVAFGRNAVPIADRCIGSSIESNVSEMLGSRLVANADGETSTRPDFDIASPLQERMPVDDDETSALVRVHIRRHG
ncbi:hypothetical protein DAA51_07400 [Bradyrhizobium sp. WBAH10]|nr:hypothetical protein [Bradyrhizobium sp. WBAH30]MDD1547371.1 hypothetical protein [Bradyrhizobium sp. WBAH41]MDD1561009.1 hypothetical protein [Bradyrhizobium sp. WBAH23]MDD1594783.1 hypothetical protein [Bradyrhizobium sp. WBAH42]NRB92327.1 hypothetical protein [Bradyrhizobium sp. WBAH10]QCJ88546.1 hypothetical protein DAA57_08520 [Bradyrhizobium yuanmingense]QCJ95913.1 hypothetical protein DAA61_08400 [Bradyrhizobium sp. WBAH33]